MRKVISGVLIAIGIVLLLVSKVWRYPGFTRISSGDPLAFERAAYQYLSWFVSLALLALGAIIALWPTKNPRLFEDLPSRPPNNKT
jgi:hypothetical protein